LFDDPAEGTIATGISGIAADGNEEDAIEVATDRRTATARLWRTVYRQTAIGPSCTLVEMARLQGGGVVTRADATVVENVYVCRNGVWKFRRVSHRPA
jgi:hypothetical protein